MKNRIAKAFAVTILVLAGLLLTACGSGAVRQPAPAAETPQPVTTEKPAPTATPAPVPSAMPEPDTAPAEDAEPETAPPEEPGTEPGAELTGPADKPSPPEDQADPEADPEASPSPTPTLPRVTKSPTDETVDEGGSCLFLAGYENAEIAVWHFVSPDGQTDMTYEAAQTAFPTMEIRNGMYSNLQLRNIPYAANGWKVYCRYSNTDAGYVDTAMARLTVIPVLARQTPQPGNELPAARRSDFEGSWADTTDGRCQILFTYRDETSLNVGILWRDLSGRRDCWNMTATVYSEGVLVYSDGHYWAEAYSNDNSYTVSAESWNGTGSFYFENGRLHWYNGQTGEEVVLKPV